MSREDDWNRVSAMAGLDTEGGIAPPPPGATISREPTQWKRTDYSVLLTEQRKVNATHIAVMRLLRAAAIEMEEIMGGPVEIMEQITTIDGFKVTFRRVPAT